MAKKWNFNVFSGKLDLTENLSTFVPYTGATADLNLGIYDFITTGTLGAGATTLSGNLNLNTSTAYTYFDINTASFTQLRWQYAYGELWESTKQTTINPPNETSWGGDIGEYYYDSVRAVDSDRWWGQWLETGCYCAVQLVMQIPTNVPYTNLTKLYYRFVGYSGRSDMEVYAYNYNTSIWDLLATGEENATDNDLNGTITSNANYYINPANNKVYFLWMTKTDGAGENEFKLNYAKTGYCVNSVLVGDMWKGDLTVDGNFSINGTYLPKDLTPYADSTYSWGSSGTRPLHIYGDSGHFAYLEHTGTIDASSFSDPVVYFHGTNNHSYEVEFSYTSSRVGDTTFFLQEYTPTGAATEATTWIGDKLLMSSDITAQVLGNTTYIGRNTDSNWYLKAGAANGLTHLILGEKFLCRSTLLNTNVDGTLNFISGLFLEPTTTSNTMGMSYIGTVNKLSAYFEGDAMFASGKKLYLRGALSGTALTMDITEYIASLDDGHVDIAAGTSIDLNADTIVTGDVTSNYIKTGSNEFLAHDVIRHTLTAGEASASSFTESWNKATQAKVVSMSIAWLDVSLTPDVVYSQVNDDTTGLPNLLCKYNGTTITVNEPWGSSTLGEGDIVTIMVTYEK